MSASARIARIVGYAVLGLTMAVFASLQFNDPDPWLWVPLYGAATVLFALAIAGWHRTWAIGVVLIAYAIVAATALPGFLDWILHHPWSDLNGVMSPERQYIEDSRELLGLVIAAATLAWLWRTPPRGRPTARGD